MESGPRFMGRDYTTMSQERSEKTKGCGCPFRWWRRGVFLAAMTVFMVDQICVADLENVTVGGQIRIRGNYWMHSFNSGDNPTLVRYETRWPAEFVRGRPIGSYLGGQTIVSHFDWDSRGPDYRIVEQRTTLNVRADFTQDVAAFIELDSFDVWGEDFRSNYLTGIDRKAQSVDDVEVYQAYVEANNVFGVPLRLRLGRQEIVLGGGWLVGNNSAMPEFTGLSFDGVRATYTQDPVTVDAFWTKLAETSPREEDGDTDFYGIYAGYRGLENVTFDAYWLWLRDASALQDTQGTPLLDALERWQGLDDYDATNLHTVGLRAAGTVGGFDFDANAAYQFGDAAHAGGLFKPYLYGDNHAHYDTWAADLDLGRTFDVKFKPRVHLGGAYFDGEDHRGITVRQWLNPFAPFARPRASISFNRLFSNTVYSFFFDEMAELSDFWTVRGGVSAHPTDGIETGLDAAYFGVVDTFDQPRFAELDGLRLVYGGDLPFLTKKSASDIGWQLHLWLKYRYSDDLLFETGWAHLFTGNALKDGNFNDMNGLLFNGGADRDDADYLYLETTLRF
jgi:hypothetical protein